MDLHNYKGQWERQIQRVKEETEISKENKQSILDFSDNLLSEGIGFAKIGRYVLDLRKFAKMLNKPFGEANEKDIRRVISLIEQSELAPESKKAFKILLRKLYRFIRGITDKGVYPPEVRWLSIALPENSKKLPEELLTDEEIYKVIDACDNIRDKALLSSIAESGCRISEIGLLKIKHISFENHGARLTVNGKTGSRRILVITSSPYIQSWLNQHPYHSNPDSYLWHNPQNKSCLCYTRIRHILGKAVKRAGIKKRVYPHLFRHSRATHLAPIMSEAAMKQYFGWTQASKMASIYIHLSGKDTDEAILKVNGIKIIKEEKESTLKPTLCLRCKTSNEPTNKFCKICSFALNAETQKEVMIKEAQRSELNSVMENLVADKEVMAFLMQKLKQKQLEGMPA